MKTRLTDTEPEQCMMNYSPFIRWERVCSLSLWSSDIAILLICQRLSLSLSLVDGGRALFWLKQGRVWDFNQTARNYSAGPKLHYPLCWCVFKNIEFLLSAHWLQHVAWNNKNNAYNTNKAMSIEIDSILRVSIGSDPFHRAGIWNKLNNYCNYVRFSNLFWQILIIPMLLQFTANFKSS